jgi:hypothetical protein
MSVRSGILFVCVFLVSSSQAQGISSDGREFFVGVMTPSFPGFWNFKSLEHSASLVIVGTQATTVRVSYVTGQDQEQGERSFSVGRNGALTVPLDLTMVQPSGPTEVPQYKCCHVIADAPVSVRFMSNGICWGTSYQALPVQCLGRKYVIFSYSDNPLAVGGAFSAENSAGQFMALAVCDGTQLTITPTVTTAAGKSGVTGGTPHPYVVNLDRGQCYLVNSLSQESTTDLTGSVIESNNPIAVFGGHQNAFTEGSAFTDASAGKGPESRNPMLQQLPPVEIFDTAGYFTIPNWEATGAIEGAGDELRVVTAPGPSSTVTLQLQQPLDMTTAPLSLQPVHITDVQVPTYASASNGKPFGLAICDQRRQVDPGPYPNASLSWVVPRSHWKTEYQYSTGVFPN